MPNRVIRDSCRTSKTLDQLSDFAERLFWRLTVTADDYGRFEAEPAVLLAQCFPLRVGRLKITTVQRAYQELVACCLVTTYVVRDKTYGLFNTWDRHQRRRAKASKYPPPTSDSICQQMTADSAEESRNRGIEESRHEEAEGSAFSTFWTQYPRKTAKQAALKAWRRLPDTAHQAIMAGLALACESDEWHKDNGRFIPHPATWLNGRRWEDEVTVNGRRRSPSDPPHSTRPEPPPPWQPTTEERRPPTEAERQQVRALIQQVAGRVKA